ncbi:MAG TPA: hypothetical protein DEQ61_03400, partial [Streptomyces sp.]|nr:hypothetical protein [Streptomyces sp.]
MQLGLPQPALSRQVRRLEELLGGALFVRDVHGVQPTALGANVLSHAESIIQRFDDLDDQLRAHRLRQRRTLRVSWATSALYEPLLDALRRLRPDGQLHIVTADSSCELDELLLAGEVDVALRDQCGGSPGACDDSIGEILLAESPMLIALPEHHALATAPVITMSDLAREEWIAASGPDGCHDFLRRVCKPYGFIPDITYDVPVNGPRGEVIRHQGCVTFTQLYRTTGPGVVRRAVSDLSMRVRHSVAYHKDSRMAEHIPALAGLLAQAYRAPVDAFAARGGRIPRTGVGRPPAPPGATTL